MVVAGIDPGLDFERFRQHFERLLVLVLCPVDHGQVVVGVGHTQMGVAT